MENEKPKKVCTLCGKSLQTLDVFSFDMNFIKKYTFQCTECNVVYDVYVNEKTKYRTSYQTLLE